MLDLLSFAGLTSLGFVNDLALAAALVAGAGALGVHSGSELHHHCAHTAAFARPAGLHRGRVSASQSFTCLANPVPLNLKVDGLSIVQ